MVFKVRKIKRTWQFKHSWDESLKTSRQKQSDKLCVLRHLFFIMGIISSQIPDIQCDHMPGVVSSWNISPRPGTESLCTRLSYAKHTPLYFLLAHKYCSWSNPACDHMPGGRFNLEFFRWKVLVRDSLKSSFLLQIGLMYRQIGPIIISMSYMIMDVFVFLFIFVIVYISFTLCTVYIYGVYDEDRQIRFLNLSLTDDYSASFTWSDDLIQTWF